MYISVYLSIFLFSLFDARLPGFETHSHYLLAMGLSGSFMEVTRFLCVFIFPMQNMRKKQLLLSVAFCSA